MPLSLTIANYPLRDKLNDRLTRHALLTGPASYTTGGVAIDNTGDFGWAETQALLGSLWNDTVIVHLWLDYANQTIVMIDAAGAQIANGVDLSGYTGQIVAFGR